jgi:hypothetical protein
VGILPIRVIPLRQGVCASQDSLFVIFDCMKECLEVHTEVPQTFEMIDIILKIMVELHAIFAIGTNEINQGRMCE